MGIKRYRLEEVITKLRQINPSIRPEDLTTLLRSDGLYAR